MSAPRPGERGAALLTVLLLVAVMAVISATALERLTLAARLGGSAAAMEQARFYELAAEQLAMRRLVSLTAPDEAQTLLAGDWHDRPFTLPLPQGTATMRVVDGGNCFNLNSLVADGTVVGNAVRPQAVAQFAALMEAIGIGAGDAARIAASAADWIDADALTMPGGAEDSAYAGYRAANRAFADPSELVAVAGVTPAHWRRLAPWVCALPTTDLSPINVNTLLPEQAPLLQMLMPGRLSAGQARAHLAARPMDGYGSINRFWSGGTLGGQQPPGDAAAQVRLKTRWFRLATTVRIGDISLAADSLIDSEDGTPRVVRRSWGPNL